jgi:hypothetical protein
VLTVVVVFIGLLLILNSLAGWIYSYTIKQFPSPSRPKPPFGWHIVSAHELGAIVRDAGGAAAGLPSSASRRWAWRCAPRRRTRPRAGWWACASAGCWRWAGAWPARSARRPE